MLVLILAPEIIIPSQTTDCKTIAVKRRFFLPPSAKLKCYTRPKLSSDEGCLANFKRRYGTKQRKRSDEVTSVANALIAADLASRYEPA